MSYTYVTKCAKQDKLIRDDYEVSAIEKKINFQLTFFCTSAFVIDQILSQLCESCFRTQNCSSLPPTSLIKEDFFFFLINLAKVDYETLRHHVAD